MFILYTLFGFFCDFLFCEKNCSLADLSHRAHNLTHSNSKFKEKKPFPVRAYLSFCSVYRLNPFEKNETQLRNNLFRYTVYRLEFLNGTSGTAQSDITTIENYLAIYGIHSDLKLWKPFKQFISSIKPLFPTKSQAKRAFRESELNLAFIRMPPTSWNTIIVRCLVAFALGGALRASEYVAPNKNPSRIQSVNIVKKRNIYRFMDNGNPSMLYLFFKSKTNQSFKPEFAVMPCICDVPLPCAYHETLRLESLISNLEENTYLFTWNDRSLVTYNDTNHAFKQVASLVGADPDSIGTHSARKARVVIGIKQGLPSHALLQVGRWASLDSVIPYLRMGPADLNQTTQAYFQKLKQSRL